MHSYSIEEARRIVMQCAKQYQTNLLGKQFMLIYRERNDNQVKDIEFRFEKGNYQHLTGIEMIDENGDIREHVSELFYSKCLNNQLAKDEIRFKKNGTTNLKLLALPVMMDLHKVTKIAGDFNYSRPYLVADKVIGNVNFCLGLRRADEYYVPASVLLEDINKMVNLIRMNLFRFVHMKSLYVLTLITVFMCAVLVADNATNLTLMLDDSASVQELEEAEQLKEEEDTSVGATFATDTVPTVADYTVEFFHSGILTLLFAIFTVLFVCSERDSGFLKNLCVCTEKRWYLIVARMASMLGFLVVQAVVVFLSMLVTNAVFENYMEIGNLVLALPTLLIQILLHLALADYLISTRINMISSPLENAVVPVTIVVGIVGLIGYLALSSFIFQKRDLY
ncbi:MAG TPA: PBECR4 domain-containing protein [Lachnospiraceae bacterium]|nr:PBECR4 domain-containing protein [Lachnospiraceae bacterium]